MFLLWQFGLVDTWGMVNYFINVGIQYGSVVAGALAFGNVSDLSPKVFLEPVLRLGVDLRYII